jgi:hypothetical protein
MIEVTAAKTSTKQRDNSEARRCSEAPFPDALRQPAIQVVCGAGLVKNEAGTYLDAGGRLSPSARCR